MASINDKIDKIKHRLHIRIALLMALPFLLSTYSMVMAFDDDYRARRDAISRDAGDAIANNKAIHTIDPWPYYANDPNLETSGQRIEHAIERYQNDEVKKPRGLRSSEEITQLPELQPNALSETTD